MPVSMTTPLRVIALALAATAFSTPLLAQTDRNGQLVEFSGAMHAAAKACGMGSPAELEAKKGEQRDMLAKMGQSGAAFDVAFAKGESAGTRRFSALAPAQRAKECQDMKDKAAAAAAHFR